MASRPEKPARLGPTELGAQPSCSLHLCFSPEEFRDLLVENKQTKKTPPTRHKDQCRYSLHPIFKAVRLRPEDVRGWKTRVFFKIFLRTAVVCCYDENCDLLLWFRNRTVHAFGEEKGWCWSPKASDSSAPAHDALLNEEVEYFIG